MLQRKKEPIDSVCATVDFTQAYGKASFDDDRPATPETLYYCGSTTKSFTAAAVLKSMETDKDIKPSLSLKTKIVDLIREDFVLTDTYATNHVTIEDALSHRTGMPRHDMSCGGPDDDLKKMTQRLRYLPMTGELREKWQYCNLMYMVLSHCIETVTKQSLGDYWRKHFWEPLGMASTFYSRAEAGEAAASQPGFEARLATGYWWSGKDKKFVEAPYMPDSPLNSGAGAIISNVLDYAKYLRAMIKQDSRILSEKSFTELRTPRIPVIYEGQAKAFIGPEMYGLGWRYAVLHGHQMFSHGGGMTGFGAHMAYLPTLSNGVGVTVLANTENGSNMAAQVILYHILHEIMGVPEEKRFDWFGFWAKLDDERIEKLEDLEEVKKRIYPELDPKKERLPQTLPLTAYEGIYRNPGYRSLTVKIAKDKLGIEAYDRTWRHNLTFEHVSGNYFVARMTPPEDANGGFQKYDVAAEFEHDANGEVERMMIEYDGEVWFEKKKTTNQGEC